jgi:perosamine synthetase
MPLRPEREIPPTAGLPLRASDLMPGPAQLAELASRHFSLPDTSLHCSGSAAFYVALRTLAAREPKRRSVVIPAFTCPLVPIVIRQAGLVPRLCDLGADHFDFDPARLGEACDEDTLAVVPTHLAGRVANVAYAKAIAARMGAFVVEDAAQALGAQRDERSVGTLGDIGFFSLAAGKGLSIYEGGLLVTRDPALGAELTETARVLIHHKPAWEYRRSAELLAYAAMYRPRTLGLAYGMPLRRALRRGDPVAAVGDDFPSTIPLHRVGRWRDAVGTRALERLPAFLQVTAALAHRRLPRLNGIEGVRVFADDAGDKGTWPYLLLSMPDRVSRDAALARLWHTGVGVSRLFIHALPDYAYLGDMHGGKDVPNARDFAARTLTISNSPWLDDETFEHICVVIEASIRLSH